MSDLIRKLLRYLHTGIPISTRARTKFKAGSCAGGMFECKIESALVFVMLHTKVNDEVLPSALFFVCLTKVIGPHSPSMYILLYNRIHEMIDSMNKLVLFLGDIACGYVRNVD